MLEKVNLLEKVNSVGLSEYLRIGNLNGNALTVMQAENRMLDFHVHEHSDELFFAIEGAFKVEYDGGFVQLDEGEFVIVPKGMPHRPVVTERVKCLLVELDNTLNAGNTGGAVK